MANRSCTALIPGIRIAVSDDALALAPLLVEVNDLHAAALPHRFRRVASGAELEAFLRARIAQESARTFVAEQGGRPVGFLVATVGEAPPTPIALPRRYGEIDTLVVAAKARRRGVGRALVRHAHRWFADQGVDRVQLVVYEFNDDARRFYERLGYETQRRSLMFLLAERSPETSPGVDATAEAPATEITVSPACQAEAEHLLKLQYLCYQSEAALYDDWSIPPLTETLAELRHAIETNLVLTARLGGEVVGSVRGHVEGSTCHVGRLVVHPRLRRRGLATRLMTELESRVPDVACFSLFTGHRSAANMRLYHRLGYAETRRDVVSPRLTLVHLDKRRDR